MPEYNDSFWNEWGGVIAFVSMMVVLFTLIGCAALAADEDTEIRDGNCVVRQHEYRYIFAEDFKKVERLCADSK